MVKVARVHAESIAEQLGITPGATLLRINGRDLEDFLDWEFLSVDSPLLIEAKLPDGELVEYELEDGLEGEPFGITADIAETMGSPGSFAGMQAVYPEMRKRGIRVLIGGDDGFPNNPTGRNARDLGLFVNYLGYTPIEALVAGTRYGGELLGMGDELGLVKVGYIADLLVVKGDPTDDVTILEDADNLAVIMQGGRFHKQRSAA